VERESFPPHDGVAVEQASYRASTIDFLLRVALSGLSCAVVVYAAVYAMTGAWQCGLAALGAGLGFCSQWASAAALRKKRYDLAAGLLMSGAIPTFCLGLLALADTTLLLAFSGALLVAVAGWMARPLPWFWTLFVTAALAGFGLFIEHQPLLPRLSASNFPFLGLVLWFIIMGMLCALLWRLVWTHRSFASLRSRVFVAFVLVAALPACAVSGSAIFVGHVSGRRQVLNHLESIAALKENDITEWAQNIHADLASSMGDRQSYEQALQLLSQEGDEASREQAREILQHKFRVMSDTMKRLDEIFILNVRGEVAASTETLYVTWARGLRPFARQSLQKPGTFVQTKAQGEGLEPINAVVATQPILDKNANAIGVLCGRTSMRQLNKIMTQRSGLGMTGETYLVGSEGVLLTQTRFPGVEPGRGVLETAVVQQVLRSHDSGSLTHEDYRGARVLSVYRWIPEIKVGLIAEQDVEEALQPVYVTLYTNAAVAMLAVGLAGLASFFFARSITRPLEALAMSAGRIEGGALDTPAEESAATEIGALARALNAMAKRVARKLEVENLVASASRGCVALDSSRSSEAVLAALESLGGLVSASRGFVYLESHHSLGGGATLATSESTDAANAEAALFFSGRLPWLRERMLAGETAHCDKIVDLPDAAIAERLYWCEAKVGALVRAPLIFGGSLRGVLGLDCVVRSNPLTTEDLRAVRLVAEIVGNALERGRNESILAESEERFRATFEQAAVGIALVAVSGRLLRVNQKLCDILGYSRDELCSTLLHALASEQDRRAESEALQRMLQSQADSITGERRYLCKNRDQIWVGVTLSLMRDASGPKYFIVVIEDISERKRAQETLDVTQAYISNILDSMPSAIIGVDARGVITHWNRAAAALPGARFRNLTEGGSGRLLGAEQGEQLADVCPRLAALFKEHWPSLQVGRPVHLERRLFADESGQRYEDLLLYPLSTKGERGVVIRVDDVSERTRLQDLMIQSEKMMSVGGLAAGMAHEINNPLSGILQAIQVVLMHLDPKSPANQRVAAAHGLDLVAMRGYLEERKALRFLDGVQDAGRRAAKIVANMLEFSRRSESRQELADLHELLDKAVELASSDYDLKKKYDFKRVELVREYDAALPRTPCAAMEIEQVLLNLLKNAAQAMFERPQDRRPRITLRTAREPGFARVEIEDNGPGMEEAVRKRVFEPFFTTKEPGQGTGLGLSVSFFIVTTNHKGTMSVVSELGKGSTFTLRLPLRA
jgi:PAS domain S-box-containing protein